MPVVAILTLQTIASFVSRLIPIIAPAIAVEFGWDGSSIGYWTASNAVGALAMLLLGAGVLKRIGGMHTLMLTLLVSAISLGLFLYPSMGVALVACFLMGMSNGAATPAGSEILQKFSPPGKRNLLFSIKQAGVPLGGMMAGLLVPLVVVLVGWRAALLVCGLIVLVPTLLTWRLGAGLDRVPRMKQRWTLLPTRQSLRNFGAPLTSLTHNAGLLKMAIVGSLFAVAQSAWFTFTVIYLVDELAFSLSLAGAVFAVMQVGGVLGRVALGWLSDYLRSATATLSIAALFSAATTALLGLTTPAWPLWAILVLAFVAGATAASWNGVQIAEVARRSPSHLIAETAAGTSILISLVNIVAPTLFAVFVAASGRYDYAFICAGACPLLVLVFLPRERAVR